MTKPTNVYIGTKTLKAVALTLGEYNTLQGWQLPADQEPNTAGYLVEYLDGGKPNHKDYEGYISWSPKAVFEASYKANGSLSFSEALQATLKADGVRIARKGWNGAGLSVYKVTPEYGIEPHLVIRTSTGRLNTWVPSSADLLAEDWVIL